ncbi:MAG: rhodanese-like domain-containing protein [Cyclobacteriaceae bacterium]
MFNVFARNKAYTDLASAEFEKELKNNREAVLLDVRTKGEYQSGKIPGAVNIDLMSPDFHSRVACLDKNKSYFVYCRSGNRSGQACSVLASKGLRPNNLAGGINSWRGKLV